jgi:hypothetical protein
MDCPRKYFYQYVLGWDSKEPKPYLVFGEGMHAAIEVLMQKGFSSDAGVDAYEAFLSVYQREYPSAGLGDIPPEASGIYSPAHALATIGEYLGEYQRDEDLDVLYTEIGGSVPIDLGDADHTMRLLYFRMDSVVRAADGVWSIEHKTTKLSNNMRTWLDKWDLSFQVGMYTHVLRLLYPDEAQGVKINSIFLALPTRADKDLDRETGNKYVRVPQRRSPDMMEVWLWNANHWFEWIELEFARLDEARENDTMMAAFPLNTESCTKYWGCPFRAFCGNWANPLRHCETPPIGFGTRYWNPQERAEQAKQVLHLEEGTK